MNIRYIYLLSLFVFLFANDLSDEQINAIHEVNQDLNKAPNFILKTSNDSTITLDSLKGKVVLINFWATWCEPCILEFYDFNSLYDKYNNKGLEILGINISTRKKELISFKNKYTDGVGRQIKYPLLYGNQTEIDKVMYDYGGVSQIPISFLVDSKGILQRIYPGALYSIHNPILDPNSSNFKRMFGFYNNDMLNSITLMHDDLVNNIESLLSEIEKKNNK